MHVEALSAAMSPRQNPANRPSAEISDERKRTGEQLQGRDAEQEKQKVQSEELLKQIKALTEDGLYSVRFERDDRTQQTVIKVVDRDSEQVIYQIPVEALLSMRASLNDLRGNIINTEG